MPKAIAFASATAMLFSAACIAQDQVEILAKSMIPLTSAVPPNPHLLTVQQAKDLINATLQVQDSPAPAYVDDPNFYCLIHLVVWKPLASSTAKPTVDYKRWYVFRGGKKWNQLDLEGTRIYGSHNIAVLAVHWTQSVDTSDAAMEAAIRAASPNLTDAQVKEALTTHQTQVKAGNLIAFSDSVGASLVKVGDKLYVHGFPPEVQATYRLEITGKLPAPLGDLATLLTAVKPNAGGTKLTNIVVPVWQGQLFSIKNVPSDVVARFLFDTTLSELDNQTFNNEGLYRFDFSAGVPLKSVKQLQYDSTGGAVTPTTVDKYTVFGLFDYFFKPVDISTDYKITQPYLVTGLGLTGKPWERTLIGLGFGYGKISGFIGANWNRTQTGVMTQNGVSTPIRQWDPHPKLVFGVNLTARQLASFLKPKQ
jgi:hypothetical protein